MGIKNYIVVALTAVFILTSCDNPHPSTTEKDEFVTVSIIESNGLHVLSTNPLKVIRGEDASFRMGFDDGLEFDSASEGTFENDTLTISNVQFSKSVFAYAIHLGDFTLTVTNDKSLGNVEISPQKEGYRLGEIVTISTYATTDRPFMCYTLNHPYRVESKWSPTGLPMSFTWQTQIEMDRDYAIYTNFIDNEAMLITYDSNGGLTIDGEEKFTVDYSIAYPFKDPRSIIASRFIHKEEHTLVSLNTKKDGNGTRIGLGSRIAHDLFIDRKLTLYAQYVEWTDPLLFDYMVIDEKTCALNGISSFSELELSIPNVIDGFIVSKIMPNFLLNNNNVKSIVFNQDLLSISERAFVNCQSLEQILFFTDLQEIYDSSFINTSLTTIFINSAKYHNAYTWLGNDMTYQFDFLDENSEYEKIVFAGHSTIRYNQSLENLQNAFPNKKCYLFGAQFGFNADLLLSILRTFTTDADKVIYCFHEGASTKKISPLLFEYLKYDFDVFVELDYSQFSGYLFQAYMLFASTFEAFSPFSDVFNDEKGVYKIIDEFGAYYWGPETNDENNYDPSYKTLKASDYTKIGNYSFLMPFMSLFPADSFFITWSTFNTNSYNTIEKRNELISFEQFIRINFSDYRFFDSIADNIYPGNYFRNMDSTHLSIYGCVYRDTRWASTLTELF